MFESIAATIHRMVLWAVGLLQAVQPHPADPLAASRDLFETLKSIAEIVAIGVGGFWTWAAFIRSRGYQPRAVITHQISHRTLGDGRLLLVVDVFLENLGEVSIALREAQTWVQQMVPLPPELAAEIEIVKHGATEAEWPHLDKVHNQDFKAKDYVIDPKERDQFRHNFIFGSDVKTMQVYTYLEPQRGGIGWKLKSTYDIDPGQPGSLSAKKQNVEAPSVEQKPGTSSEGEATQRTASSKEGPVAESSQEELDRGAF